MSIGKFDTANVTKQTSLLVWMTWGLTAALFVSGFIAPPKGIIDASVLKAGCILLAILGVIVLREAVHEGMDAKVTHGDTTIEITNDNNN